jgi:CubicO group peptidase (beta-lactamase class C family)
MKRMDEMHLDDTFTAMVEEDLVPGLVAFVRVGNEAYCKAFGVNDIHTGAPMAEDAIFRFYSNSKVFGGAVGLNLQTQGKLSLEDPVSKYIPSFQRDWSILKQDENGTDAVDIFNALTGDRSTLRYRLEPNKVQMQIKHLLSEKSGIGYDFVLGDTSLACNTLREIVAAPELYFTSRRIVGSNLSLADFCDVIADAGVLTAQPGEASYGHGATVFGRIVELTQNTKLSAYLDETLFEPCDMDVRFFFSDEDPQAAQVPGMYAPVSSKNAGYTMVPCQESVKNSTNHTDHFAGPRACESLDTGLCMPVGSYAKFFDVLLNGGRTPAGKQVLSEAAVRTLTHDQTALGPFSHGWQVRPCGITTEDRTWITTVCSWLGYASTTAYLFPDENAYVILGQQIMSYTPAGDVVRNLLRKQVRSVLSAMIGDVAL